MRGATLLFECQPPENAHFNPRAPCGARPKDEDALGFPKTFQSTRPVRGATRPLDDLLNGDTISIHAPRAGRDINVMWISV